MVNEQLVQEAVDLFNETKIMDSLDINNEYEANIFRKLYDKECQIYVLFGRMNEEEMNEYRIAVKYIK
jgi:hypothetical protein